MREWRSGRGWSDSNASALSFIGFDRAKRLDPAGELKPGDGKPASGYACAVSCIDWYGNSRPIFTGGRILALMGTDLVEGRMDKGRIREIGRVDPDGTTAALKLVRPGQPASGEGRSVGIAAAGDQRSGLRRSTKCLIS